MVIFHSYVSLPEGIPFQMYPNILFHSFSHRPRENPLHHEGQHPQQRAIFQHRRQLPSPRQPLEGGHVVRQTSHVLVVALAGRGVSGPKNWAANVVEPNEK